MNKYTTLVCPGAGAGAGSRSRNFSIPAPAPAKSFGSDRLRLRLRNPAKISVNLQLSGWVFTYKLLHSCDQLRYVGQPELGNRPTVVRSCYDIACSSNVVEFLTELGCR